MLCIASRLVLAMPGLVRSQKALATKILSLYPRNAEVNENTHSALILLNDVTTGFPIAVRITCNLKYVFIDI